MPQPSSKRATGWRVRYRPFCERGRNIFYCLTEPSAQAHKEAVNKLYPNEADISLAARSFHSVVSTFDKKKRPLRDAYEQGGKVIFLTDFDESSMLLRDFIKRAWSPTSTLKLGGNLGRKVGRPSEYHDRRRIMLAGARRSALPRV